MRNYLILLFCIFSLSAFASETSGLQYEARFPIGVAINPDLLDSNLSYQKIVETEFNSLTSENVLKWQTIHPEQNKFDFSKGDALVAFAQNHHMRVHGHCLIWGENLPDWLKSFQGDKDDWKNLLKTHIQTVVSHYKGQIVAWDVVNEALNIDGSLRGLSQGENKLSNIWAEHIGKDYIALAFQYAHEADPKALLFYNDFGQEKPVKRKAVLALIHDLQQQHSPVSGIGTQSHISVTTNPKDLQEEFKDFANTGLLIHVSELDIATNPANKTDYHMTPDISLQQEKLYEIVAGMYISIIPPAQQYGITFWNVSDHDTWIRYHFKRMDNPLLFDENYNRKPAYLQFIRGLQK